MKQRLVGTLILAVVLGGFAAGPVSAQMPVSVRVGDRTAKIVTRPSADADVVLSADAGAVLDVVDGDGQWYWVSLPPDHSGVRRRGWIQAKDVQPVHSLQPMARPARTSTIPPTAEEIRADIRVEKARREAELRQREYEAAVQLRSEQAAGHGVTELPSSRGSFDSARPQYKIFGGYAALWDQSDSITFPMGWVVSVARSMNNSAAIVGEVSGSYKSASVLGVNRASASIHTFTAGPQFSGRAGRFMTFGHVLGGLAVTRGSLFGFSTSSTGLALMPGAGVEVPVAHGLGVRVGGDLGLVHDLGGWYNGFRLATGFVVMSKR